MPALDEDGNLTQPGTTPYQGGPGLEQTREHDPADIAGGLGGEWRVKWSHERGAPFAYTPAAVADVDDDGAVELFHVRMVEPALPHSPATSALYAFDGATGEMRWRFDLDDDRVCGNANLALADVNGDGVVEILFGSDRAFYAVDPGGALVWRTRQRGHPAERHEGSPRVADVDGDGTPECFFATSDNENDEGYVYLLDGATGAVRWRDHVENDHGFRGTGIYDANDDGTAELYAGERYGGFHSWRPDGTVRFSDAVDRGGYHTGPAFLGAGDGTADLVAGTMNGHVVRVSPGGDLLAEASFPDAGGRHGDQVDAGVAVADADGDGVSEVVASTRTETRLLSAADLSVLETVDNDGHAACSWWADVDDDGAYEFTTSHTADGKVAVRAHGVSGRLEREAVVGPRGQTEGSHLSGRQIAGQAVADVDGDGDLELVVVDMSSGLSVIEGSE
jgi:outer membrane protein assembly factor BamB